MKIYLEKAIFVNRAPFEKLELDFNENEIAVLSAANGRGKTTILSHIVDAFYEIAKPHFSNEFEDKTNKFYRVSSPIYNLTPNTPSYVYLRFKSQSEYIDYVDISNPCTEAEYNNAICIEDKIPFKDFQGALKGQGAVKRASSSNNNWKGKVEKVFSNSIITYFPSYRYEQPGYLNDPYKIKMDFAKSSDFSGYLKNPIEVVSGLNQLANWIMDIVLDMRMNSDVESQTLFSNINTILSQMFLSKKYGNFRFGIGPRGLGGARIQIVEEKDGDVKQIYPTIFNLSAGEASVLCLFGELLRQADNYRNNIELSDITGIVLIDEVDKHLHIKLQREVLPKLFNRFPNVQFIVSSHSPFLSMGLAEQAGERTKIIDLDNFEISKDPTTNELYQEVYGMIVGENEKYREMYQALEKEIKQGKIPLIITEGKTDRQHIIKAKEKLNIDLDIKFHQITDDFGDSKLKNLLEQFSKVEQSRKIIGIFDRDNETIVSEIEKCDSNSKNYNNNVFAFCIPLVNEEIYGKEISIEHYYPKELLTKEDSNNRRLFLGNEFYPTGNSIDGRYQTKISNIQHKIKVNGVIDDKVYKRDDLEQKNSIALTKANFAGLIETDNDFIGDFSNFNLIFDKIRNIINS